jgi:uncharacterized protein
MKIASRCNLNCSYCYMYNLGDESYRNQPKFMSAEVTEALVQRAARHCAAHGITSFTLAMHGGEPLLAGVKRVEILIELARERFAAVGVNIQFALQTNGVLLTDAWCAFLAEQGVQVGVSIDGPPAVHDRQRVTHGGKGSYAAAVAGLRRAQRHGLRPGLLSVIDIASDPTEAYQHLKTLGPDRVDFLLPEGNHLMPPAGKGLAQRGTPYADWLLTVFKLWWNEPDTPFSVRLFEQILGATLGVRFRADSIGVNENEVLVVEANGDIGPLDVLRVALPGISQTGINVLDHELDDALGQYAVALYQGSHMDIAEQCRRCPINRICGGGYVSHRYGGATGFDNPSVYCADLTRLITELRNCAVGMLPQDLRMRANIHPISFEEASSIQTGRSA